ncbi:hypothetical protein J3L16_11950 [Alteromonas sp. 5E99-2]|uniref:hypothetical protein n=1 Tax=Alteromonas sp. 5E99-2 TaxID=2817683 RepID=UPI001A98CF0D|nr:hypothetical protein [Alteromonas sp. 5E99-2]MBO1256396.1 hypothetical protein [Alteromonas sp. 5E99-2]
MKISITKMAITFFTIGLSGVLPLAQAHIMVAQKGTLNIVDDGIYMVLSVPVSAFEGIDTDNDGKLSKTEFRDKRTDIAETVKSNISLKNGKQEISLQGLLLSPVLSHHHIDEPATQLIVTGKYTVHEPDANLNYSLGLFGQTNSEQSIEITVKNKAHKFEEKSVLTPTASTLNFSVFSE